MILYDKERNNCAHHAVRRLNEIWDMSIVFANGDEWQRDFVIMLRKQFTPVTKPSEGCLVVMDQGDGSQHLGVFTDWCIEHNFEPLTGGSGCVIISDIGVINGLYSKVRYYVPNKALQK